MSRFSKSAAKKLGWQFTHEKEAEELHLGDRVRVLEPDLRAEKYFGANDKQEVQAISEGLLLEKIQVIEAARANQLERQPEIAPHANDEIAVPHGDLPVAPEATDEALELVAEHGLDLGQIEPNKSGKVTAAQVKKALAQDASEDAPEESA